MDGSTYDVSVYTGIRRADGSLFADLGTFRWFGVSEHMRTWLAGSCRSTAFWLLTDFDETPGGYVLEYRTIVREAGTDVVVSDTGLLQFPGLSYADVVRFEGYALDELRQMLNEFARERERPASPSRKRSKVRTILRTIWQGIRSRVAS